MPCAYDAVKIGFCFFARNNFFRIFFLGAAMLRDFFRTTRQTLWYSTFAASRRSSAT
jgi:hypothetical protein